MNGFHFSHDAEAVFGDLDAMGHVNNVVFLRWIETARIAYWIHVTGQKTHPGGPDKEKDPDKEKNKDKSEGARVPGPGVVSGALIDMILARTEIDYRRPVNCGERLNVFVRTALIKRSSMVFEYAVTARSDEKIVAEAKTVVVCYDYQMMRPKLVPADMKAAILALDTEARIEI